MMWKRPGAHAVSIANVVSLIVFLFAGCAGDGDQRELTELTIHPERTEMAVGDRARFEAVGVRADGEEVEVSPEWSHSGNLGTFGDTGEFEAERVGEGQIVATVDGVEAVSRIVVNPGAASELKLSADADHVPAGGETTLTVAISDEHGNPVPEIDVTLSAEPDTVKLDSPRGRTSADGTFATTLAFEGETGELAVTASTDDLTDSIALDVVPGPPARLSLEADPARILTGTSTSIQAEVTDAFDNPVPETEVRFSVTTSGASVSESSVATNAEGHASVLMTAADDVGDNVVEASVGELPAETIEVHGGRLSRLAVRPEHTEVRSGTTQSFVARGFDEAGTEVRIAPEWGVRGEIGAIDDDGILTAVRAGTGSVVATLRNVTATSTVTVEPGDLTTIAISPEAASVTAGDEIRLEAKGFDAAGNAIEIAPEWSFTEQSDERLATLDASGRFRAETAGRFEVQATIDDVRAAASLEVAPGALADIRLTPGEIRAEAGSEQIFEATAYDVHGNEIEVSPRWTVDGDIGTVDASGRFRATKAGQGELVATSAGRAGRASIAVVPSELAAIRVVPEQREIVSGTTAHFTAGGEDAFGNPVDVSPEWSVTGEIGTIDENGRFTAVLAGSGTVVARVGALAGERPVRVVPGELTTIELAPPRVELAAGTSETFRAVGFDAAGNEIDLSPDWKVSGDVGHISPEGRFEARVAGVGKVIARQSSIAQEASVSVRAGKLVAVELEPARLDAAAGESTAFSAIGKDAYGNEIDIDPSWTITGGVGEIDAESGHFTATTVGHGRVVATVAGVGGEALVDVEAGALARIDIGPPLEMIAGETRRVSASGFDASGNALSVVPEWSVVGDVGRIDSSGELTAVKAGRGEVAATADGVTGRITVDVRPGPLAWLEVRPSKATVSSTDTASFRVVAKDHFGNEVGVDPEWTVRRDIGHVSQDGTFTATVAGTGRVVARAASLEAYADVTVTPGPTVSIALIPASTKIAAGSTVKFEAEGSDAHGNPTRVEPSWSVSSDVGTIDENGVFTAVSAGSGRVLAVLPGLVGSADVTTGPGELTELSVSAKRDEVRSGETLSIDAVGFDSYGNRIESPDVTWSVEDGFGTINSETGLFTAVQAGSGTIAAEHASVRGTLRLKVVPGVPSPATSSIRVSPESVRASTDARITVHVDVRDQFRNPIPEVVVELRTSRPDEDTIRAETTQTGADGIATFRVSSSAPGTSTLEVLADGVTLTRNVRVSFHDGASSGVRE